MNFRTEVDLPKKETEIRHSDQIMLFGSCFAENIGNLLLTNKFRCDVNPFGILYNPLSVAEAVRRILADKAYEEEELFCSSGRWYSFMHHGAFSGNSCEECMTHINSRLKRASRELPHLDWLMITWGTAWVYTLKETGMIVGNCHKLPDKLFSRRLLGVEEIVQAYAVLLEEVRKVNPAIRVLFTISPIRHIKDGLHGNQISKSTLLLAVHVLQQRFPNCFYFPSYEIMMDELRDYRFYAEDMLHPSPLAITYLWECFADSYFSPQTFQILKEWEVVRKALNHKPFDAQSETYRNFLTQIVLKINRLKEKFPYFDVQKEIEQCQAQLRI